MKHMDGGQIDGQEVSCAPILAQIPKKSRVLSGKPRFPRNPEYYPVRLIKIAEWSCRSCSKFINESYIVLYNLKIDQVFFYRKNDRNFRFLPIKGALLLVVGEPRVDTHVLPHGTRDAVAPHPGEEAEGPHQLLDVRGQGRLNRVVGLKWSKMGHTLF